jgi:hypothetical protein
MDHDRAGLRVRAPDQDHCAEQTRLFREVFRRGVNARLALNHCRHSTAGRVDYECTPWGSPSYGIFGWQRPCYLMADGHAATFRELMETTDWDRYGTGRDPRCANCMMHCGYEPTAVADSTSSLGNVVRSIRAIF